jgi:hypothetical protein
MSRRFEQGRGVREERRGGVEAEEGLEVDAIRGGTTGGDHVIFELRRSLLDGNGILRTISYVVRHLISKRAPLRHAICAAVGDGTEEHVASAVSIS